MEPPLSGNATPVAPDGAALTALLRDYAQVPGAHDELVGPDGALRPVWRPFAGYLAGLSRDELRLRVQRGEQYLRDAGVFYRLYSDANSQPRDWPLSPVPVIVTESDWERIAEGLCQRADLLEQVLADLYGPGHLVSGGYLPASLVAENPEWLRPLVGVRPRGGHFLHFLAFEVGRSPDGSWFVLADRTQAPSGAGFALENRMATSRMFPDFFRDSNVLRLAGFFRSLRDGFNGLSRPDGMGVGILSPGPMNDTYFEQAYLARYLGFTLLEGEDLVVQDGRTMVRTALGLRPVDVLWRRLDARFADPLELGAASRIGTPGLVSAVRSGQVTLVNALGSGLVESRAMMAFLPRIAELVTGKPLKLPNIATWWCGQASERDHVISRARELLIGDALSCGLPFDIRQTAVEGQAGQQPGESSEGWIRRRAGHLVGQERVLLSTSPALEKGRLEPRPMSLRVFLVRTPAGWKVMSGGYARIGGRRDAEAIAMQHGGSVTDVWVVADRRIHPETISPAAEKFRRSAPAVVPARAADNLFWLGRYVERTEVAVRQLRAYHLRLAETGNPERPLLKLLELHLKAQGHDVSVPFGPALAGGLGQALGCAGKVRDRFSVDGMAALEELVTLASDLQHGERLSGDEAAKALGRLLRRLGGFSGLVHENMYRFMSWRFLTTGRALERADALSWALSVFADPDAPEGALDLAVEIGDSTITHRQRYSVATNRDTVIDLMALDPENPRSLLFQFGELRSQLETMPYSRPVGPMGALPRQLLESHTGLAVLSPPELTTGRLIALRGALSEVTGLIGESYFA